MGASQSIERRHAASATRLAAPQPAPALLPAPMDALLPDDLLGAILARAGFREGRSTSAVSRRWRRVFFSEPSLWKQGLFVNVRGLSEPALLPAWRGSRAAVQRRSLVRLLQRAAPVLPSLALIDRTVGESPLPAWLPHILHALEPSQLHRLSLHRIQLTHAALGPLLGLSQLAELHLSCTGRQALSPDVLAALGQLASLASFSLAAEHLPARLPAMLARLQGLTCLSLDTWDRGSLPAGLPAALQRLTQLARLELRSDSFQPPPDLLPRPCLSPEGSTAVQPAAQQADLPGSATAAEPAAAHPAGAHAAQQSAGAIVGSRPLAALTCLILRTRIFLPEQLQAVGGLPALQHLELRSTLPLPNGVDPLLPPLTALTGLTCLRLWERPATVWGGDAVPLALPLIRRLPHLELLSLYAPRIQLPDGSVCRFDTGARLRLGEERRHHILFERSPTATCSSRDQPPLACGEPPSAGSASEVHVGVADTALEPGALQALLSAVLQAAGEPRLHRLSLRGCSIHSADSWQECGHLLTGTTRLSLSHCMEASRHGTDADLAADISTLLALTPRLRHLTIQCPAQEGSDSGFKLSAGLPAALTGGLLPQLSSLQVTGAELLELPAGTWAAGLAELSLEHNCLHPAGALPALAAATRLRRINLAANPGLLASRQTAEVLAALPRLSALRLAPATTLQGGAPKSSRPPSALVDELRRRRPCLELLCQLATAEELDSIFFYPVWHS